MQLELESKLQNLKQKQQWSTSKKNELSLNLETQEWSQMI